MPIVRFEKEHQRSLHPGGYHQLGEEREKAQTWKYQKPMPRELEKQKHSAVMKSQLEPQGNFQGEEEPKVK